MARAVSADLVMLGGRRRQKLEAIVRRPTAPMRMVVRARIVLAAAAGTPNARIAAEVGADVGTARRVRHRYVTEGIAALDDRPRPGRPLVYDLDARLAVVATATSLPPGAATAWSHASIAEHLNEQYRIPISASQIGRILADLDVKPHLVRGWLNRPDDPAFFAKARAICDLYRNPPANAVLLSIDEKTGIQAKSRKHPTRPVRPGRPARREFEYVRHGTVSLMAAMNVVDGTVHGKIIARNDSATFVEFLTEIDAQVPAHLAIYLVMDNGSSHVSKATKAWLEAHPRFHVTRTPCHASWLNMIEIWFSVLTRKVLRRGEFASRQALADKIIEFIGEYNAKARPFRWTYDGQPLKAA
ncbi:MAG TPA: IS630 family transposase [Gemmatimonadales bacterium]